MVRDVDVARLASSALRCAMAFPGPEPFPLSACDSDTLELLNPQDASMLRLRGFTH